MGWNAFLCAFGFLVRLMKYHLPLRINTILRVSVVVADNTKEARVKSDNCYEREFGREMLIGLMSQEWEKYASDVLLPRVVP